MNQVANNARWLAIAQIIRLGIQLLSVTIVARILSPENYGIVALSSAVMAFINLFKDLGIGASLVQTKVLSQAHKNTAFVISFVMSVLLMVIVVVGAPFIANYYHEADLKWILIIVALGFPISSFGIVPTSLMEREGRFKQLAMIEAITNFITFVMTLTLALTGFGVYSLVVPSLLLLPFSQFWLLKINTWHPSFKASKESFNDMFGFSANLTGFNLINFFSRNLDVFIVGKLLGTVSLGLYATGIKLMLVPLQTITYVSNRALFPVLSQLQNESEAFKTTYLNAVAYVCLITFPMMFCLWINRELFVEFVYGDKWLGLEGLLTWLCLAGVVQSINSTTGPVFMALGKTQTLLKIGTYSAIVQCLSFYFGSKQDILKLCEFYFYANVSIFFLNFYIVKNKIGADFFDIYKILYPPLLSCVLMILISHYIQENLKIHLLPIKLLITVVAGICVYLIVLKILFPKSLNTILNSIRFSKKHT